MIKLLKKLSINIYIYILLIFPSIATEPQNTLVIIHTNDTQTQPERNIGFAGVAAYRNQWVNILGESNVLLVDAGDIIAGGGESDLLGPASQGQAYIDMMNAVGYDYVVPGNHEFAYGVSRAIDLMNQVSGTVLSCNFIDLMEKTPVFSAYDIKEIQGVKFGFVGVTTTASLTTYATSIFQDENENFIYGFGEHDNEISSYVQNSVDSALSEGAEFVICLGHIGIPDSTTLIQSTTGINLFIDGHSHSLDLGSEIENKNGDIVVRTQAGGFFDAVGEIIIDLETLSFQMNYVDETFVDKDQNVLQTIAEINSFYFPQDILSELLEPDSTEKLSEIVDSEMNYDLEEIQTYVDPQEDFQKDEKSWHYIHGIILIATAISTMSFLISVRNKENNDLKGV